MRSDMEMEWSWVGGARVSSGSVGNVISNFQQLLYA